MPMKPGTKLSAPLMLLALLSVSGCETNGPAPNCAGFQPIYMHPDDKLTERTESAIIKHDETGEKLGCW